MTNICPVCGYAELPRPAYSGPKADRPSFEICVSCGYQFGVTDNDKQISHAEWRQKWINNGMKWRSNGKHSPPAWDPVEQLKNIGVTLKTN